MTEEEEERGFNFLLNPQPPLHEAQSKIQSSWCPSCSPLLYQHNPETSLVLRDQGSEVAPSWDHCRLSQKTLPWANAVSSAELFQDSETSQVWINLYHNKQNSTPVSAHKKTQQELLVAPMDGGGGGGGIRNGPYCPLPKIGANLTTSPGAMWGSVSARWELNLWSYNQRLTAVPLYTMAAAKEQQSNVKLQIFFT